MEINTATLQFIASDYFNTNDRDSYNIFLECYNEIRNYPFVIAGGQEAFIFCLYRIAADISSNRFFNTATDKLGRRIYECEDENETHCKSLSYIISDALYETYEEAALAYLTEDYLEVKGLVGGCPEVADLVEAKRMRILTQ